MHFPGERVQIDVKFVPESCIVGDAAGEKFYQYTAIDEFSRWRYLEAFQEHRENKSGSCPPAVWRKVRLHKGFDAHKAPDTPPGRIDDIVGVLQIVPALVGDQGIAEPTGLDSLKNPFLIHAGVKLLIGIPSFHWRYGKRCAHFEYIVFSIVTGGYTSVSPHVDILTT